MEAQLLRLLQKISIFHSFLWHNSTSGHKENLLILTDAIHNHLSCDNAKKGNHMIIIQNLFLVFRLILFPISGFPGMENVIVPKQKWHNSLRPKMKWKKKWNAKPFGKLRIPNSNAYNAASIQSRKRGNDNISRKIRAKGGKSVKCQQIQVQKRKKRKINNKIHKTNLENGKKRNLFYCTIYYIHFRNNNINWEVVQ